MSREIFICIVNNTPDLRDLLQLAGTCRRLRTFYKNTAWLCYAARYHLIRVRDVALLPGTLQVRSGLVLSAHVLIRIERAHESKTEDALAMVLWRKHYFNLFGFGGIARFFKCILGDFFYDNEAHFQYDSAGNVVCIIDREGSGRWCRKRANTLDYDIKNVELFEWLATVAFPRTFSWRLIHFPEGKFSEVKRHEVYHGTAIQIIFQSAGSTIDQVLLNTLRAAGKVKVLRGLEKQVKERCSVYFFLAAANIFSKCV